MLTRRSFLRTTGAAGAAAVAAFTDDGLARVAAAGRVSRADAAGRRDVAGDEDYWREIQQAFTLDRTIINLNNGGCCPSPRVVHEALKRYLDISNQAPVYHMWQILEPNIETRAAAARRGVRLRSRGDGDHAQRERGAADRAARHRPARRATRSSRPTRTTARMLDTWEQRVRRDGIKLTKISFPVPPPSMDDLADRLDRRDHAGDEGPALLPHHEPDRADLPGEARSATRRARAASRRSSTARTRSRTSRSRRGDLECDYYGTSLHKWLLAPIGTGFLYVRRENIATLWPLTPAARVARRTTSASSRRSARTRRRTTTRSPRR